MPRRNIRRFTVCAAALFLLLAAGCGILGEGVMQAAEGLKNAEYPNGPFENNLESARAYLLEQMQEKYGIEFTAAGDGELENYGPFAGATYTCKVAPTGAPEQVTTALVSQSMYSDVRDGYAVYFFKEEAEAPVMALCSTKTYVVEPQVCLEMPETAYTWTAEDSLEQFLSRSGAYVRTTLCLEDGLDTRTYAEQILDFLHSIGELSCNVYVQMRANDTYIFFSEANVLDGFDPDSYTLEEIENRVIRRLKTGDPQ